MQAHLMLSGAADMKPHQLTLLMFDDLFRDKQTPAQTDPYGTAPQSCVALTGISWPRPDAEVLLAGERRL